MVNLGDRSRAAYISVQMLLMHLSLAYPKSHTLILSEYRCELSHLPNRTLKK